MSAEKGWIAAPQPPKLQKHRSYAAYRLKKIAERERQQALDAERGGNG